MEYGPAPESDKEALAWLGEARARVRPLHRRRVDRAGGALFDVINPATGKSIARGHAGHEGGRRRRGERRARGAARVEGARAARPRALPVRARARRAEALAPARRAREHGQRQVDSRDARHRRSARRAALLSSRRLGAAARRGVRRLRGDRRRRPDHSVELPAADAGVEDRAGARRRGTRSCSSRRSSRRSRRWRSPRSRTRSGCRRAWSTS